MHPALALGGFILIYAALTASCLPLALMMTLTAGALFGLWVGAAAALTGGAIGAMVTYSAARFAAFGAGASSEGRVQRAVEAIRQDAFPLVLAGRLFPFMPFALVNIAAGLAAAPVRTFLPAAILGSIPTAVIYSSLGDRFGRVLLGGRWPDLALMEDPGVILPLVGLALLWLAGAVVKHRLGRAGPGKAKAL